MSISIRIQKINIIVSTFNWKRRCSVRKNEKKNMDWIILSKDQNRRQIKCNQTPTRSFSMKTIFAEFNVNQFQQPNECKFIQSNVYQCIAFYDFQSFYFRVWSINSFKNHESYIDCQMFLNQLNDAPLQICFPITDRNMEPTIIDERKNIWTMKKNV